MKPRVSITMPVLNGQKYIAEAIESIAAQTYRDLELIVIDDGSTDRTPEIVDQFRSRLSIQYVKHPRNLGVARSVNDGLRHSTGEFIAFLDHDDGWFPQFLEKQVGHLDARPDVGMVHSDFQLTDAQGRVTCESVAKFRRRTRPSGWVFRDLFLDSFIVGNSVLIRKECFDRLGGFDEHVPWGDYHMWLRIARHYQIDFTPEVLTMYRQHSNQHSRAITVADPHVDPSGLAVLRSILALYPDAAKDLGQSTIDRRMATLYFDLAYMWYHGEARKAARIPLRKSIRLRPSDPRPYLLYAGACLPAWQQAAARSVWRAVQTLWTRDRHVTGIAHLERH